MRGIKIKRQSYGGQDNKRAIFGLGRRGVRVLSVFQVASPLDNFPIATFRKYSVVNETMQTILLLLSPQRPSWIQATCQRNKVVDN